jgi:hypothetical protein
MLDGMGDEYRLLSCQSARPEIVYMR